MSRSFFLTGCLLVGWLVGAVFLLFLPAKSKFDGYQQFTCVFQDVRDKVELCRDGGAYRCCEQLQYTVVIENIDGSESGYPNVTRAALCSCSGSCASDFLQGVSEGKEVTCWYDPETGDLQFVRTLPMAAVACLTIPSTFLIVWLAIACSQLWGRIRRGAGRREEREGGYSRVPDAPNDPPPPVLYHEGRLTRDGNGEMHLASSGDGASGPYRVRVYAESPLCCTCLTASCKVVFSPCGHSCCCCTCSLEFTKCPLCRAPIDRRILPLRGAVFPDPEEADPASESSSAASNPSSSLADCALVNEAGLHQTS